MYTWAKPFCDLVMFIPDYVIHYTLLINGLVGDKSKNVISLLELNIAYNIVIYMFEPLIPQLIVYICFRNNSASESTIVVKYRL